GPRPGRTRRRRRRGPAARTWVFLRNPLAGPQGEFAARRGCPNLTASAGRLQPFSGRSTKGGDLQSPRPRSNIPTAAWASPSQAPGPGESSKRPGLDTDASVAPDRPRLLAGDRRPVGLLPAAGVRPVPDGPAHRAPGRHFHAARQLPVLPD